MNPTSLPSSNARTGSRLPIRLLVPALLLLSSAPAAAQTKPDARQLRAPAAPPVVVLVFQGGKATLAVLGEGLTLDTSVSPPVIRAATASVTASKLVCAADGSWTLPAGCNPPLAVYRNGLRQWAADDYSISGPALRFRDGAADPSLNDDTVIAECRQ